MIKHLMSCDVTPDPTDLYACCRVLDEYLDLSSLDSINKINEDEICTRFGNCFFFFNSLYTRRLFFSAPKPLYTRLDHKTSDYSR